MAVHVDDGLWVRLGRSDRLYSRVADNGGLADVAAVASGWELADHALGPVWQHPAYPYFAASVLVLATMLGLSLLRQALSRPSAAELAREMADLGAKAPVGGVIEAAVARGINDALRPLAEEFRRDIREIDKRVAWLEGHHEASRWRPGMRDRRTQT